MAQLELADKLILLALVDSATKEQINSQIFNSLAGKKCVYITVGKPYKSIETGLQKSVDTNNFLFIDMVTKMVDPDIKKSEKCIFLDSPQNLTDLGIVLMNATSNIKPKEGFIVFDSVSLLMLHNDPKSINKFFHLVTTKLRASNTYGFLLATKNEIDEKTLATLSEFCDDVLGR
jgi:KaiC/GvpD/RAD55 family RecA-like ATPase